MHSFLSDRTDRTIFPIEKFILRKNLRSVGASLQLQEVDSLILNELNWTLELKDRMLVIPSSFIPVLRHFSNLQAGHFFRVAMVTGHWAPLRQT